MILTVDIGNSRIKWALWRDAVLAEQGAHDYAAAGLDSVLSHAWRELAPPGAVMLACVAGAAVEQALQGWLQQHWQLEARVLRTSKRFADLTNGYANPEQHGADRWAAMIAARAQYQSPLCVISCGTATTVDVIAANGQHLGGQIMPGSELMLVALRQGTAALTTLQPGPLATDIFATNTAAAVMQGVMQMAAAGLDRACDAARERLGPEMKTLITGGAAAAMMPLMKNSVEAQPDLVLHGLYLAAQQGQA